MRILFTEGLGGVTPRRVTRKGRHRMAIRFAFSSGPIVTSGTCAWYHPRVTELRPRKGRCRSVAQFAGCRRRYVCRRFAPRRRAVMARRAPRRDSRMVKRRAYK